MTDPRDDALTKGVAVAVAAIDDELRMARDCGAGATVLALNAIKRDIAARVASLSAPPSQSERHHEPSEDRETVYMRMPPYGTIPWKQIIAAVGAAQGCDWKPVTDGYTGHQMVHINMNSINRIVSYFVATKTSLTPYVRPAESAVVLTLIDALTGLESSYEEGEGVSYARLEARSAIKTAQDFLASPTPYVRPAKRGDALFASAAAFTAALADDSGTPAKAVADNVRECMDDLGVTPRRIEAAEDEKLVEEMRDKYVDALNACDTPLQAMRGALALARKALIPAQRLVDDVTARAMSRATTEYARKALTPAPTPYVRPAAEIRAEIERVRASNNPDRSWVHFRIAALEWTLTPSTQEPR